MACLTKISKLKCFGNHLLKIKLRIPHQQPILKFYPAQCKTFQPKRYLHSSYSCLGERVQFKLSDIGEGIREVTVKEWYVKVGDRVSQFDNICEVQSDKAAVTITSRYDGVIRKLHHDVDATAFVGQPLVDIEMEDGFVVEDGSQSAPAVEEASDGDSSSSSSSSDDETVSGDQGGKSKALATPAVRRIASENKVTLSQVKGTGRDGRVLKEDIMRFIESGGSAASSTPVSTPPSISAHKPVQVRGPPVVVDKEDKKIQLKGVMKAMKKTMELANQIPHFAYSDEIDITNLVEFRQQAKLILKDSSVKLSFMPFMIKAASMALSEYPMLNALTDETCDHIIYKASHNIGVAMDTPLGLIVPCVKSVESMSVLDIAEDLQRLMQLGSKNKLAIGDITGGTFTLSNIGNIGGTYTKPVILPPEVIIGGIGRVQKLPRFADDGSVCAAHIINISWCADHRVVDGATVARFSNLWKRYLEHPQSMLLNLR